MAITCIGRRIAPENSTECPFRGRSRACHNVTLGRRDFYRHLCHALGVPYGSTAGDVFLSVTRHVEDLARERVFPVFLVDEAHLLHQDTLDHLHILLNYGWDSKSLLSLILIGLPELDERLALRRNRSLHSRLSYRVSIEPLSPDDTAHYVRMRLAAVGLQQGALYLRCHRHAPRSDLRIPARLDRVAHSALRLAARKKRKLVERDVIQAVMQSSGYLGGAP